MEQRDIQEAFESGAGVASASVKAQLVQKWAPLLEGLNPKKQRKLCENMAVLMENESRYLRNLEEQTRAANVGSFTKFIFPILRRVYPNLIAMDIVSVQPITAPSGLVFFYDMKYGTSKGQVTAGQKFVKDFNANYSSEFIDGELIGMGDASASLFNGLLSFTPIRSGTGLVKAQSLTVKAGNITGTAASNGTISGTGIASGSVDFTTGAITVTFSAPPANGVEVLVEYEYVSEMNSNVPQVNMDIASVTVQAITRKVKALWSSEAADDLRNLHGLEAEAEHLAGIAQEFGLEIDREVIEDIRVNATTSTATWDRQVPSGISEVDHIRSLLTKMSKVSNAIHKETMRAPANWAVSSLEASTLIEQLQTCGDYRPNVFSDGEPGLPLPMGNFGVYRMGTLLNRWGVYRDPFLQDDTILMGLKGSNFLDAGYALCPYVALQMTPTFLDPNDQSFKKGFRTRYAKKMLRPEYYGTVKLLNL